MKVLRAFQINKRDGEYSVSTVHNVVNDDSGKVIKRNAVESHYIMDETIKEHVSVIEAYLEGRLNPVVGEG